MFSFLKNLRNPEKRYGTGGIIDLPDERDFRAEEIYTAFEPVQWIEKSQNQWRRFPIFDQNGSAACVSFSVAKLLGIENFLEEGKFVVYSARDIYSRGYQPNGGMFYRDGMDIGYKYGATVEQLMPFQKLGEDAMRKADDRKSIDEQIALIGRGGNYFALPFDFDAIASIVQRGKGVALGTRFGSGQWKNGEVKLDVNGQYGHAVTVVDFTLYKGQKALIFDNSWGESWGFGGQGVLTEDQKSGITAAWYYESLPNNWREIQQPTTEKPKYQFNIDIKLGDKNVEVSKLQECLKWEGAFPYSIPITGYFGGITFDAVKKFQEKYGIEQTGYVGPKTRDKLNELYG